MILPARASSPVLRAEKVPAPEPEDKAVLMILYWECKGPEWDRSDGWGSDMPLERWYGVKVRRGRVVELVLKNNNLSGELQHV